MRNKKFILISLVMAIISLILFFWLGACGKVVEDITTTTIETITTTTTTSTTTTILDITSPSISSVSPTNEANGVSVEATISAVFSETMDASSITTSTFTLVSSYGAVTGSVTYDASGKTTTFTPSANLHNTLTYTATLSSSVKDPAGNLMVSPYSWSFAIRDISVNWTQTYDDAANSNDIGYGIAVDGSGNVYVTGYETVTGQGTNIWVRKYQP